MNALFTPPIYPALHKYHAPYPPEPSWLLNGWIELTSWWRPGWRPMCETVFDVEQQLRARPGIACTAIRRGPAIGDHVPVLEKCVVSMHPHTGRLVAMAIPAERRSTK